MANGLLGNIASPQLSNIAGAQQLGIQNRLQNQLLGQQQLQQQRQMQAQQLAGEILAQRVGGKLADLSRLSPDQLLAVSEATGIPIDQQGRQKHFFGGAQVAKAVLDAAGPQAAIDFLNEEKGFLNEFGIASPRIDELIGTFNADPKAGEAELNSFVQSGINMGILQDPRNLKGGRQVQSSKILDDGTVVKVLRNGDVIVEDAEGNIVTGEARRKAIKEAEEFGVEVTGKRAGARARATQSVKASGAAFDQLRQIGQNISNIDEAIRLVRDEGAGTGFIESRFPSIRQSSIELQNLRGRLGLDIVGATTFGALSASELEFALDVALPQTLDGPALVDWLERKKKAQRKLSRFLEGVAIFLGKGGTVAEFIEIQQQKILKKLPEGTVANDDGTFTLPNGDIVEPE